MDKQFCVYILASKLNGALYIGVTSQRSARLRRARNRAGEAAEEVAPRLEELIEAQNPDWRDLYDEIV